MKRITLLALFSFLFIQGQIFAQQDRSFDHGQAYTSLLGMEVLKTDIIVNENEDKVKGTPFYNDKFTNGVVYLPNKKTTETLSLALNLEENKLIFKEGETFKIFNPDIIEGIAFQDEAGETIDFFVTGFSSPKNEITSNTALRVIYNGDIKMFAKHSVSYDRGNFRDPITNLRVEKYKKSTQYFIRNSEGQFVKTSLKTKKLLNAIGQNQNELKSFVKKNKIKGKSESDAFRILEYYDALNKESS